MTWYLPLYTKVTTYCCPRTGLRPQRPDLSIRRNNGVPEVHGLCPVKHLYGYPLLNTGKHIRKARQPPESPSSVSVSLPSFLLDRACISDILLHFGVASEKQTVPPVGI